MADSGSDSYVGVIVVLVAVVALVAAVNGDPLTGASAGSSSAPTSAGSSSTSTARPVSKATTTRASTNIPGGALPACPGKVISNKSAGRGQDALNLKVYYSASDGGRNCAVATKVGFPQGSGQVVITLRFADSKSTTWPKFAEHRSTFSATRSGSIYLDDTDNRCVRAQARLVPAAGGKTVSVSSGRTGCR